MKTNVLKMIILIILLTSVLSYSQNSESDTIQKPIKIDYKQQKGLFITFRFMDSVSVKLIDRINVKKENKTLGRLSYELKSEIKALEQKNITSLSSNFKNWNLYRAEKEKNNLLIGNFNAQKEITISVKRKARKNGLLLFGGGLIVGAVGFALLL